MDLIKREGGERLYTQSITKGISEKLNEITKGENGNDK